MQHVEQVAIEKPTDIGSWFSEPGKQHPRLIRHAYTYLAMNAVQLFYTNLLLI